MDKDLLEDAIQLCDKAIRTKKDSVDCERGFREISIGEVFQTFFDGQVLYYKNHRTPRFLQKKGVIDMDKFFSDSRNDIKRRAEGYFEVVFDYIKAEKWMNSEINQLLNKPDHHVIIPAGKDHIYENGIIAIALQNNTQDVIDLSNSPEVKPVFDVFYHLYAQSPQTSFTKQELLDEYKRVTYEEIAWNQFTKKVSDIKKRIKAKVTFQKRIILRFDKKSQTYEFKILSLISSD